MSHPPPQGVSTAALAPLHKRGLAAIVDRGCISGHAGPRLSSGALQAIAASLEALTGPLSAAAWAAAR